MTDQDILRRAFHGDADDWYRIHELSRDSDFVRRILSVLEKHENENPAAVASWREYLKEHGLVES